MKKLFAILIGLMGSIAVWAQSSIRVEVHNIVELSERFNLVFIIEGEREPSDFQWNASQDFTVVWGPQKGTSRSKEEPLLPLFSAYINHAVYEINREKIRTAKNRTGKEYPRDPNLEISLSLCRHDQNQCNMQTENRDRIVVEVRLQERTKEKIGHRSDARTLFRVGTGAKINKQSHKDLHDHVGVPEEEDDALIIYSEKMEKPE